MSSIVTPNAALKKMVDGNARFVCGLRSVASITAIGKRGELAEKGQRPFAVVLSCSDARVPGEMVFDTGLGDLFIVRVAGNIVAPSLLGSIEFAVLKFETPLVVVMGHTRCGAVTAACAGRNGIPSPSIEEIVSRIEPSVRSELKRAPNADAQSTDFINAVTWKNVQMSVDTVLECSPILKEREREKRIGIVSAVYDLDTGYVEFRNVADYVRNGISSSPNFGPEISGYFVKE